MTTTEAGRRRGTDFYQRTLSVVGFFALWELGARTIGADDIFFVPVSLIAVELWNWFASGEIFPHLKASGIELVVGFLMALGVGLAIGAAMGLSRAAYNALDPLVSGLYSTPILALTPLFIIWLGLGLASKIALIFLISVFPIIMNTTAGIKDVDKLHLDAARSFGAKPHELVLKVRAPAAVPYIIVGMRLAIARSIVGIFVAELVGAQVGIGYSISRAATLFDMPKMFAGVAVLSVTGVLASVLLLQVERRIAPWRLDSEGA